MRSQIKELVMVGIGTALIFFAVRCAIFMPEDIWAVLRYISQAITLTVFFLGLYEKFLWRHIPFRKTPHIAGEYIGVIKYHYEGNDGEKNSKITISQSLLTTSVKIETDEITSNSIMSKLIEEHDEHILYYTYITNPKSKFSKENPVQRGTCRLVVNAKGEFTGVYWTSRQQIGDMTLKKGTSVEESHE